MPGTRSLRTLTVSTNANRLNSSNGPPSPTFSDATNVSAMNFGPSGPEKIITRADLKASLQAYEDLLNSCANYRSVLMSMSKATAIFADAMENCSRLKGPTYESSTRLQASAGLHHLMGNHWHVMSDTLDRKFEKPLRQHLENYRTVVNERSAAYEKTLNEKSKIIRQTEMGNMNKRGRNLQSFREALAVLQRQVDDLDELKAMHYQEIMEHEEEIWDFTQGKVCLVVRSTMDVFDRFTAKASDPVIEHMLATVPDPFDSYGPPTTDDQIFSILPPLSVIANAPSSSPSPHNSSTPDLAPSEAATSPPKASWMPSTGGYFSESNSAWADIPSPVSPSPPRSISPPPARSISPPTVSSSRRNSHPPSRKSESKLRSVLTVIDETHGKQASDSSVRAATNGAASEPSSHRSFTPNGVSKHEPPDDSWLSHIRNPSLTPDDASSLTPRNSGLFVSPSPPPDENEQHKHDNSQTPTPDAIPLPS